MMLQAEGESQFKDGKPNFVDNAKLKEIMQVLKDMIDNNVLYLANNWSDYTDQAVQGDMVAGVMNGNWIILQSRRLQTTVESGRLHLFQHLRVVKAMHQTVVLHFTSQATASRQTLLRNS